MANKEKEKEIPFVMLAGSVNRFAPCCNAPAKSVVKTVAIKG